MGVKCEKIITEWKGKYKQQRWIVSRLGCGRGIQADIEKDNKVGIWFKLSIKVAKIDVTVWPGGKDICKKDDYDSVRIK